MLETRDGARPAKPERHSDHRIDWSLEHAQEEQHHHPGNRQRIEHLFGKEEDGISEVTKLQSSNQICEIS